MCILKKPINEAKKIELKKYLTTALKTIAEDDDAILISKFVKKICIYPDNTCDVEIVAHSTGSTPKLQTEQIKYFGCWFAVKMGI